MTTPFYLEGETSLHVEPCVVVIFGATGDLTHRKLVPGLYNLSVDGLLPAHFSLVGFARRDWSNEAFRESLHSGIAEHSRRLPIETTRWEEFAAHSHFVSSPFDELEGYLRLKTLLDEIDTASATRCNRLFYLATSPEYFEVIAAQLNAAGLLNEGAEVARQSRVIVEKPFGHDLASAKQLNAALLRNMREEQIYRIDHYLGKETVQNLLVFRFSNGIFEPIWNHKYIDHIEISVCESIGVGSRAGYFESVGILRDIVQNHALQLLSLVCLEPPVAFEADAVRDEKVKVLRSIRALAPADVGAKVIRARYQSGSVDGKRVEGYLAEPGVATDSMTETFVALELEIDNWRWAGVPIFLRAGKRMAKRVTEISIHFRHVPHRLFQGEDVAKVKPNILSFQIQPEEGISFKISSKPPGPRVRVQSVNMDFNYGSSFGVEPPEAYERLLLDAMRGDATLFTRDDEIEEAWSILQPIFDSWRQTGSATPAMYGYEAGTWGPKVADEMLIKRIGGSWRRL
jgi:glucose-6-phosphate 1-dehydrogenase